MKKILLSLFLVTTIALQSQVPTEILYGAIDRSSLQKTPFDKWFISGYQDYQPSVDVLQSLKKSDLKGICIEVFFGTWCGDSRREVPRFLKLLDEIGLPVKNIRLIAVGGSDSLIKQSPDHEEAGKGIFRVPTFILYKNDKELGRINEYPVNSLERDLYAILLNQPYSPNYKSFATIRNWMKDGTLSDRNMSIRGLAMQLRSLVNNERELNSLGYLLLNQGNKEAALRIMQFNAQLYPESANALSSLGEAFLKNSDAKSALPLLERSLELNKDPLLVKEILKVLYQAKLAEPGTK